MIIHNKYIFVHLTKTGGTFVREFLKKYIQGHIIQLQGKSIQKHGPLSDISDSVLESRPTFGFIRNPLDFYISLWAANITKRATKHRPDRKKWFKDVEVKKDPNKFINFLINKATSNVNYFDFPLMHKLDIGVLTYRYLYLYYNHDIFKEPNWVKKHKKYKLVDHVLLFEDGLAKSLDNLFEHHIFPLNKIQKKALYKYPQRNKSKHSYFMDYYDKKTIELVQHKDRFIFYRHYRDLLD